MLRGQDLLSQVAVAAGLAPSPTPENAEELESAVRSLKRELRISPIRRTTLIEAAMHRRILTNGAGARAAVEALSGEAPGVAPAAGRIRILQRTGGAVS